MHGVGEGWRLDGAGIAEHGRLRATVRASEPLPDAIDLVERFTIDWTAEHRGNRLAIGRSANSLYVLRAPPTSPLVHTPLHIAATNARGVQDEDSIVARIWHEFTDREVRRVRDGRVLRYYGEWNDKAPAELRRMLVGGTGQCVAWSYLLYAALGSQGIESEIKNVIFYWEEKISETAFVPHELRHLPVKSGNATVNVKFESIKQVELRPNGDKGLPGVTITLLNGKSKDFTLAIDGRIKGQDEFGEVEVPASGLKRLILK